MPAPAPAAPLPVPSDATAGSRKAGSAEGRTANNAVYGELLGPGIFWSINYDRILFDRLALRAGFSYSSIDFHSRFLGEVEFVAFPLSASYVGIGRKAHRLELGAGATFMYDLADTHYGLIPSIFAIVGYRYQPADGWAVVRVGASPLLTFPAQGDRDGFLPTGYLSFGGSF